MEGVLMKEYHLAYIFDSKYSDKEKKKIPKSFLKDMELCLTVPVRILICTRTEKNLKKQTVLISLWKVLNTCVEWNNNNKKNTFSVFREIVSMILYFKFLFIYYIFKLYEIKLLSKSTA